MKSKKLSVETINQGVVKFLEHTNMGSGSMGDIDLQQLLQAYLLKPELRKEINIAAKISD